MTSQYKQRKPPCIAVISSSSEHSTFRICIKQYRFGQLVRFEVLLINQSITGTTSNSFSPLQTPTFTKRNAARVTSLRNYTCNKKSLCFSDLQNVYLNNGNRLRGKQNNISSNQWRNVACRSGKFQLNDG
jgi:hypothetical protein